MMFLIKNNKALRKRTNVFFASLFFVSMNSGSEQFNDDILSSLNESNREVNEYINNKMSSYRCLVTAADNSFECSERGVDIYSMNEAGRFDVSLNRKNSLEKIVFMEISGVNKKKFVEYEEKTIKMCLKSISCESMDSVSSKTISRKFDLMFVLHGGTELVKNTILVGYLEEK